ncbi:hypothetical protein [Nesterenkonia alkaliphila]|uniref:Ribbon-helix-helix protein, CopG family n=1 Tax=Nesterenkonia alkaliphila TaxID=1463631 RepID=A0A7K1UI38_9MICC|nr:hypothetical protein [Nesterenkonia alkaliphila]MVT26138.1 hypothetical protein [Nesterenkonia alkaliphila]GFZ84058.1 hypothetical protein GCM10011359_11060 [Nesterenkonia alkaliphila]
MAMTLRLPEDTDRKLEELAASRHVSKQSLIIQATEKLLQEDENKRKVDRAVDYTFERYGKVVERLADA